MAYKRGFWNERYAKEGFLYGESPNEYLKEKLDGLPFGRAIFPADGEGRNSVYAARLGWRVDAFDQSEIGIAKAIVLADLNEVKVNYTVTDIERMVYSGVPFDLVVLIYAHFLQDDRRRLHRKLASMLRSGGHLVLEGFAKEHFKNQLHNPNVGGPRNLDMLYDLDEIKSDFSGFDFLEAYQTDTLLSEGDAHHGEATVVRVFAIKNDREE